MAIVKYDDLIIGCVYVTRGGTAILYDDSEVIWGFDRVKVIKKFNSIVGNRRVRVQTSWGTELDCPEDYPFETTTEQYIKSEFKLIGPYKSKKVIPFSEAVKKGICKEEDILLKKEDVIENPEKVKSSKSCKSATETSDFKQKIVDYFSKPRKMTDAVKHFGTQYQKIRYTIMNIKKDGFNLDRFDLKQSKEDGKTTFQLVKMEKNK